MKITEANELLKDGYLPFEAGYKRLDDGVLLIACRSSLIGVTGKMIDWWFSYIDGTEDYKLWHPTEHVFSSWIGERGTGRYIGGTHIAHEFLGNSTELHKLKINFLDPSGILDTGRFKESGVSTAIYARIGMEDKPGFAGKMVHLIRDTIYGCEMRSRFWLGLFEENDLPNTPEVRKSIFPDEFAEGLCKHSHEEMSILPTFLPALYAKHHNG